VSDPPHLVPAVKTWFPVGGHVGTEHEIQIMRHFPAFVEQNVPIIVKAKAELHTNTYAMPQVVKAVGLFNNDLSENGLQFQDTFRQVILTVQNAGGSVSYGSIIRVIRDGTLFGPDVAKELTNVWGSINDYAPDQVPWHLRIAYYTDFEQCHKILCAMCIYLCVKYHRIDTLDSVMQRIRKEKLATPHWGGLPALLALVQGHYRRLDPVHKKACPLIDFFITCVSQNPGEQSLRMTMESQFSAAIDGAKQSWQSRYGNRIMDDQDVLEDVCTKFYSDWRRRQNFLIVDTLI
jgi:hypothetical protein